LATKPLLVVACLAVACWAVPLSRNALSFEDFIVQYNRSYSQEEYAHRRAVFEANKVLVDEVNAQAGSWQAQLNEFADLTFDEFSSRLGANGQDCDATVRPFEELRQIPASKDWREAGVITPVKDQGVCGSCWSFSTTGCLEAHHAIKTKKLVSLSEQNLIDCAQAFGNKGCFGGLPSQAFEYVHYNGGLDTESSYPYRGAFHREACHFNESQVGSTVSSIVNVTQNDETQILNAVGSTGPVSIAYHCSIAFQFYHKVIVVGCLLFFV